MIGTTNAIQIKTEYTTDDHTIFLMTDSLEDKSKHHWLVTQRNVLILDNEARKRDDRRRSIWFDPKAQGMIVLPMECARTGTNDWTIEYWFRCGSSVPAAAVYHQRHSSGTQYGFSLGDGGVVPNRGLFMGNAAGSGWAISEGMGTAQTLDVWRHYAVVRASNVIYRFENGILIGTDNYTVSISEPSINPVLGAYNYSAANLDCIIQDFRISDIARYTANFTPPERFI